MVLVGALNVGKMVLLFEDKIKPIAILENINTISIKIYGLIRGTVWWFEMGSTILLFFEKGVFRPNLEVNQKVKFSEPIGEKI